MPSSTGSSPQRRKPNRVAASARGIEPEALIERHAPRLFVDDLMRQFIQARQRRGETQNEVNARVGAADALVSKWECGARMPSGFLLWCWADALGGRLVFVPNPKKTDG
jgi:DNA-binding transcriptional regulator YiaG